MTMRLLLNRATLARTAAIAPLACIVSCGDSDPGLDSFFPVGLAGLALPAFSSLVKHFRPLACRKQRHGSRNQVVQGTGSLAASGDQQTHRAVAFGQALFGWLEGNH